MTSAGPPREPPIYRPFALLAWGTTLFVATPLGLWMLAWLYLGAPAPGLEAAPLHAALQTFGFFATLIPGVAQHLVPRFTGRPVARAPIVPWLLALLAGALASRLAGAWRAAPAWTLAGALAHAVAFVVFGVWLWRALDPPPLALVRRHLAAATAWLAAAATFEAIVRARALAAGLPADRAGLAAVHTAALGAGVIGWVLGVLLRAGPMFVPDWRVPPALGRAVPGLLAAGVLVAVAGELAVAGALARLGDALVLGTLLAVLGTAGVLRRAPRALPMLARSPGEARIFRLAALSATLAGAGVLGAAVAAWTGGPARLVADAARHLVTVGFLASVVVAMTFRLIPVLEGVPLPWPALRHVALGGLAAAVVLRSAEILAGWGWRGIGPLVVLSGALAWLALACVAANLVGAWLGGPRRARTRRDTPRGSP